MMILGNVGTNSSASDTDKMQISVRREPSGKDSEGATNDANDVRKPPKKSLSKRRDGSKKKEKKIKTKKTRSDSEKSSSSSSSGDDFDLDSSDKNCLSTTSTNSTVSLDIDIDAKNFGSSSSHSSSDSKPKKGKKIKSPQRDSDPVARDQPRSSSRPQGSAPSSRPTMGVKHQSVRARPQGSAPSSRPAMVKYQSLRDRRGLSFESLHGKSIHKSGRTRGSGKIENLSEALSNNGTPGGKKKSVLQLKREKQLQDNRQSPSKTTSKENDDSEVISGSSINSGSTGGSFCDGSNSDDCSIATDGSLESVTAAPLETAPKKASSSASDDATSTTALEDSISVHDDATLEKRSSCLTGDTLSPSLVSSMSTFHEEVEDDSPTTTTTDSMGVPKRPSLTNASTGPLGTPVREYRQQRGPRSAPARSFSTSALRVNHPDRPRKVTRQRSLQFNEKVRVKRVPCQAQLVESEEELADLWFQPDEYEAIKRKTMALIRAVQSDDTGGVTYCTRGLERYFTVEEVQDCRNMAWDSVLDEQDFQRDNRTFDDNRLSQVYSKCTMQSLQEAIERGKSDEESIARYTKKTRQKLMRAYSLPPVLRPHSSP